MPSRKRSRKILAISIDREKIGSFNKLQTLGKSKLKMQNR